MRWPAAATALSASALCAVILGGWTVATAALSSSSSSAPAIDAKLTITGAANAKADTEVRYQAVIENLGTPYVGPASLILRLPKSYKLTFSSNATCDRTTDYQLECLVRSVQETKTTVYFTFKVASTLSCTATGGTLIGTLYIPGERATTNNVSKRPLSFTCVPEAATLSVALSGPTPVVQGKRNSYTMTVKNAGKKDAKGVRVLGHFAGSSLSADGCIIGAPQTTRMTDSVTYPNFSVGCAIDLLKGQSSQSFTVTLTSPSVTYGPGCVVRTLTQKAILQADPLWPEHVAEKAVEMKCP